MSEIIELTDAEKTSLACFLLNTDTWPVKDRIDGLVDKLNALRTPDPVGTLRQISGRANYLWKAANGWVILGNATGEPRTGGGYGFGKEPEYLPDSDLRVVKSDLRYLPVDD